MANVLVLGVGPLPFENTEKLHAPGLRTWQLAEVLAQRRHFVTVAVIDFGDFQQKIDPKNFQARREDLGTNINLIRVPYHEKMTKEVLVTLHVATRFTCIISTTDIMNALAVDLDIDVPLWLDYNGDPFAEKQQQARVYQNDASLLPQWHMYAKGLLRGDKFSCCSEAQRYAMIGELGFVGRLTNRLDTSDVIQVMPNCSQAVKDEKVGRKYYGLKGHQIPAEAFVVLWSGGYNTWCDPETLFNGLELLMEAAPEAHFLTTGGSIEGHDSESFSLFSDRVETSRYRDRYHFIGWRATDEMASIFEQTDVAVLTDRYSIEGELGTRTRIMDWIQFEIPVVCSELCETARTFSEKGLIFGYEVGSAKSFCDSILMVRNNKSEAKVIAKRAREFFLQEFQQEKIFEPLTQWSMRPTFASDHKKLEHTDSAEPISILAGIVLGDKSPIREPSRKSPGLLGRIFKTK